MRTKTKKLPKKIEKEIEKNPNMQRWDILLSDYVWSVKQLEKFAPMFTKQHWVYASQLQIFSEDLLRKYRDKIHWDEGFPYMRYHFTHEFIREMKDYIDWYYIFEQNKLDKDFIREFKDFIKWDDWFIVSRTQHFTIPLLEEFKKYIDWSGISKTQKLNEEFMKKYG